VGVIHRNDVGLSANRGTRAVDGGSQAHNGKACDDTDYSNALDGPAAQPHSNNGSVVRIHLRLPLAGKLDGQHTPLYCTMVNRCSQLSYTVV
jgi:hypothetical protein